MHSRKLKCKVNKIIVACFFSKTYCKSLSHPLITEILCAKPSNLIYISQMHAFLLLLQGLYSVSCEWNHLNAKNWHSCGQISPFVTFGEHRHAPESAACPVPSESSRLFSGNASASLQLSASSGRKPCFRLDSVSDLTVSPSKPMGMSLSLAMEARLGPQQLDEFQMRNYKLLRHWKVLFLYPLTSGIRLLSCIIATLRKALYSSRESELSKVNKLESQGQMPQLIWMWMWEYH